MNIKSLVNLFLLVSFLLAACSAPTATPTVATTATPQAESSATPTPNAAVTPRPNIQSIEQTALPGSDLIVLADKIAPSIILVHSDGEAWGCAKSRCSEGIFTDGRSGFPRMPKYILLFDTSNNPPRYEVIFTEGEYQQGKLEGHSWVVRGNRFEGVEWSKAIFYLIGTNDDFMSKRLIDLRDRADNRRLCFEGNGISPAYHCN